MTGQMSFRALLDTKPTLKWFIVIGIIMIILGVLLSFVSIIGIILAWIGIFLTMLSVIALFYLWFTERYLPQPRMGRR
ncbi:MAG: hypothetical protein ACXADB_07685 [Candidatus Hermodarchaeia archaeon]|jgi:Na+-driven multidrug efflux pump